jgi:hypothetical protein
MFHTCPSLKPFHLALNWRKLEASAGPLARGVPTVAAGSLNHTYILPFSVLATFPRFVSGGDSELINSGVDLMMRTAMRLLGKKEDGRSVLALMDVPDEDDGDGEGC